jgi:hypothetical protein
MNHIAMNAVPVSGSLETNALEARAPALVPRWYARATVARGHVDVPARRREAADTPCLGRSGSDIADEPALLRCEGDFWTIGYETQTVRLRDSRGLRYLAVLLYHPGRRVHVHEIMRVAIGDIPPSVPYWCTLSSRSDLGDAGDVLDGRARAEYRARLTDLEHELEEAEQANDLGRTTKLRDEIQMLGHELLEAARGRKAASHVERARIAVTKGMKTALAKIAERHPELGRHLFATVRRGYWCVYQPDPRRPIEWQR